MKRILWFRRDLRVTDNPLLSLGGEVLPIFIFDTHIIASLAKNDRRVSFIFDKVVHLKTALIEKGLDLKIYFGNPLNIFTSLETQGFDEVVASGDYDPYTKERDLKVSHILYFRYIEDTYIFKPNEVLKDDGSPYLVFTPFYNKAKTCFTQKHMQAYSMSEHTLYTIKYEGITRLDGNKEVHLPLQITSIGFEQNLAPIDSLAKKLDHLQQILPNYAKERDFLAVDASSNLSIELRFGTLSIRALLRFLVTQKKEKIDTEPFFRQLIFRDYYAYLLYHFPNLASENYKYPFNGIEDKQKYAAFCEARTGVPVVDAGVRELLQSGAMHNRVRMICASFFTKDLLLPWQWGEKFFAQHLLDYDAASNILSWQWSAGTGIDPQPYFRIFNPYAQSKKFDKDAVYMKHWIPEMADIEAKHLHDEAYLLEHAHQGYPQPMLQHKEARERALAYYKGHL